MGTGNYVADYKDRKLNCNFCDGRGRFFVVTCDKKSKSQQIKETVKKFYDDGFVKTYNEIKGLWKELKEKGETECPVCGGTGVVEEWY